MEKYCLEIYEPDSDEGVLITFKSNTPFLSISKGDILHTDFFKNEELQGPLLVTEVKHIIWDAEAGDGPKHKLCIFTEITV